MNREALPSILCVDDEPRIVDSLAVHLRRDYQVFAANGGNSALQMLKEKGAPAVIVSDMRMPGMDGATLLKHVRQLYPETTRILLTGEPGRDAAIGCVTAVVDPLAIVGEGSALVGDVVEYGGFAAAGGASSRWWSSASRSRGRRR